MPLYLGLDSSTQSLSAIVIEFDDDTRRVVFESALSFDETFPQYGTDHGVLHGVDPSVVVSSPLLWSEALDEMIGRVSRSVDVTRIAAISGSAQQHGSVYLNGATGVLMAALDFRQPIGTQVASMLSRSVAPVWLDSSTATECAEIAAVVGGDDILRARTGSRAFERFTGPQIRKFYKEDPVAYADTERIHLVSSFLASLLIGGHAPIDPGDGAGMNLMDLRTKDWWPPAVGATAPGLAAKLPALMPSSTICGSLSRYWQARHGLHAAKVAVWSGDNPCSLVGTGLVREGHIAISLGTSDTIFGPMREPRTDASGTGHVFGSPMGDYMGLTVFSNGSLARQRVRDAFGLTWKEFSRALGETPPGNHGRLLLPWFEPEITPRVRHPGAYRHGLTTDDGPGNVRAVVEAQQMAMALHSRWMNVEINTIHATGGAAANREVLQVMADVFGADVFQFEVANSACLGAALRAAHADYAANGRPMSWDDVLKGLAEPVRATRVQPDAERRDVYRDLIQKYRAFERSHISSGRR